jgi:hypothetical protein
MAQKRPPRRPKLRAPPVRRYADVSAMPGSLPARIPAAPGLAAARPTFGHVPCALLPMRMGTSTPSPSPLHSLLTLLACAKHGRRAPPLPAVILRALDEPPHPSPAQVEPCRVCSMADRCLVTRLRRPLHPATPLAVVLLGPGRRCAWLEGRQPPLS